MNEMLKFIDANYQQRIIHIIRERFGILIRAQHKNELQKILIEAWHQFNCTPEEYIKAIAENSESSALMEHLVAAITVGETYFFRDKKQIKLMQELILPNIIQRKRRENDLGL